MERRKFFGAKRWARFLALLISLCVVLSGVITGDTKTRTVAASVVNTTGEQQTVNAVIVDPGVSEERIVKLSADKKGKKKFDYSGIPAYNGKAAVEVNKGKPFFKKKDKKKITVGTEYYSPLDKLGRCGTCYACVGKEIMPSAGEQRGEIGQIRPSGWHTVKYADIISDLYLYNRCHLVAWMLGDENANECNLITGTRYMNVTGMLPYEEKVCDYVRNTGHHVMYRVTPYFVGDELVARGVLMEAQSIEDNKLSFCVWCYNVQPGIIIDYATGDSKKDVYYHYMGVLKRRIIKWLNM